MPWWNTSNWILRTLPTPTLPLFFFSDRLDTTYLDIRCANHVYDKNKNFNHNSLHTSLLKTSFRLKKWNPMICKKPKNNTTMFY